MRGCQRRNYTAGTTTVCDPEHTLAGCGLLREGCVLPPVQWRLIVILIRPARQEAIPLLFEMIRELRSYEQSLDKLTTTPDELERDGFGPDPRFRALVASWEGKPAGYALFFDCYSTWRGRQLFLEDLFRPQ